MIPVWSVWFISEWGLWGGGFYWSPLGGVGIDGTVSVSVWPFEISDCNIQTGSGRFGLFMIWGYGAGEFV